MAKFIPFQTAGKAEPVFINVDVCSCAVEGPTDTFPQTDGTEVIGPSVILYVVTANDTYWRINCTMDQFLALVNE